MGTFIVGTIILVVVVAIVANMIKDKRNGKTIQCGGNCSHCHKNCS